MGDDFEMDEKYLQWIKDISTRLSADLCEELTDVKSFSVTNLKYMNLSYFVKRYNLFPSHRSEYSPTLQIYSKLKN